MPSAAVRKLALDTSSHALNLKMKRPCFCPYLEGGFSITINPSSRPMIAAHRFLDTAA